MKSSKRFYLSVDGETEKWYFEHFQHLINQHEAADYRVSITPKVGKTPASFVKTIAPIDKDAIAFHVCDYESNDDCHTAKFKSVLDELKDVPMNRKTGKRIKEYTLGYSNFTFELWMVLHKRRCFSEKAHRGQYLRDIIRAYGTHFDTIVDYKKESNFKNLLSTITLEDVFRAIGYAEAIRIRNTQNKRQIEYKGFEYFKDNPDLTIHVVVKRILTECGVTSI